MEAQLAFVVCLLKGRSRMNMCVGVGAAAASQHRCTVPLLVW